MDANEYASLVAEIARLHVCENKPVHKTVAKAVIKFTPMAVLANSMREPTEDELLEVVEQHNPFAVEDLSDELRARYTAICKLQLDVTTAICKYREERLLPVSWRILETSASRYLTMGEAVPECKSSDDDKMAEFHVEDEAHQAAESYTLVMESVGVPVEVEIAVFNRYHERIQ